MRSLHTLILRGAILSDQTKVGQTSIASLSYFLQALKLLTMLTEILFFDLVNKFLQLFAYFYENFHFEKKISDMCIIHQRDHVEKMYFEIDFTCF